MKSIFTLKTLLILLLSGLFITSCNKSDDDDAASDIKLKLSELNSIDYPLDIDTWIITDTSASTSDFAGLSAAIEALSSSGREISLEFPYLTSIPDYAIFGESAYKNTLRATALVSISAESATSIGEWAFGYCYSITSIDLPLATSIGDSAFSWCSALTSIELPSVITIGESAFSYCYSITSAKAPLATTIGKEAFFGCEAMESASLTSVVTVEDGAFKNCESLTTISLPAATSVADMAFYSCYGMISANLPSVTTIGSKVFDGCYDLSMVLLASNSGVKLESVDSNLFFTTPTSNIILTVSSANEEYISEDGVTLTVGNFSSTFGEILVIN